MEEEDDGFDWERERAQKKQNDSKKKGKREGASSGDKGLKRPG